MMIKNREELAQLRAKATKKLNSFDCIIHICCGTGCLAGGAGEIYETFKALVQDTPGVTLDFSPCGGKCGDEHLVNVSKTGCHGFCEKGPLVQIEPLGVMYVHVKPEDCQEIMEKTVLKGEVVERLVYELDGKKIAKRDEIPFYARQNRVVLKNCGTIAAEDIEEYIAKGGYVALEKALFDMTDEEICKTIIDSGLRGRGGGGFPAGSKWDGARKQDRKSVV